MSAGTTSDRPAADGMTPPPPQQSARRGRSARWGAYLEGVVAIVLGAAGLGEALRIRAEVRPETPSFGVVGPDGYLMAVAALLVAAGVWSIAKAVLNDVRERRERAGPSTGSVDRSGRPEGPGMSRRVMLLGAAFTAYACLVGVLGFSTSTLIFLLVASKIAGMRSWRWAAVFAVAVTVGVHLLFVVEAEMPLPTGILL